MTSAAAPPPPRLLPAGLILLVLAVFAPVAGFDFLKLDDNLNVYENRLVLHLSWANLAQLWRAPLESLYIPLTYSLWALIAKLATLFTAPGQPANPHFFHTANLLLHLLNTTLAYRLLLALRQNRWGAAAGALLFALHPVQVEPVAWVTGMKDLLSGTLSLTALICYCQTAAPARDGAGTTPFRAYLAATFSFIAAMLAKPGAITLPLAAFLCGRLILEKKPRQLLLELAPWLLLALPILLVTTHAQPAQGGAPLLGPWARLAVGGDTVFFYLGKLIFPFHLGPDYGRTPTAALAHPWLPLTGILPYLLAGALAWRGPAGGRLSGGLFLAALLPVLGFLSFNFQHISTVADRYLYLALLGPAFALAWLCGRHGHRRPCQIGVALLLLFLAGTSALQLRHWRNSETLANQAIRVNPASWLAYNDLGLALLDRHQPEEALRAWRKAIALNPAFVSAYINLANGLSELRQAPASIQALRQALTVEPNSAKAAFNLGVVHQELGQHQEAIAAFRQALANRPDFAAAYANLGVELEAVGQLGAAESAYRQALALAADSAEAANNLGHLLTELGRPAEAIPLLLQALRLRPDQPLPAHNLALAYCRQGQYRQAIPHANRARALGLVDPNLEQLLQPYR